MVTATIYICGCLVIVVLPLTVLTNSHVLATVGVHQMMCEITKGVVYAPSEVENWWHIF